MLRNCRGLIFFGLCLFQCGSVLSAGPPNDLFANRIFLTGSNLVVNGNNNGAGTEPGEFVGSDNQVLLSSVWYSWTAPETGAVRLWVQDATFPCMVTLYRGAAIGELTRLIDPVDTTQWHLDAGDRIEIGVTSVYWPLGGGGGYGPFTLHLQFSVPLPTSPNDQFADALPIDPLPYQMTGNLYGATRELNEPLGLYGDSGTETLWWYFAPVQKGMLTVTAGAPIFPPPFYPRLIAYRGNSMTGLEHLETSDGASVSVRTDPGVTNWFQLTSMPSGGAADEFVLAASFQPVATNDHFGSSIQLETTNVSVREWIFDASIEPDEPLPEPSVNRTLWWSWAAPAEGRVTLTPVWNVALGAPSRFALYSGPILSRLTNVTLKPLGWDGPFIFASQVGQIYHLQVRPQSDSSESTGFDLSFQEFGPAVNDQFSQARWFASSTARSTESTLGATREPGEPQHRGGEANKSLWWRWDVPVTSLDAHASLGPGILDNATVAVYQGASVDTLRLIAKGENSVTFPATASETYYVAVELEQSMNGEVELFCSIPFDPFFPAVHQDIPHNLVANPSFETLGGSLFAGWSGQIGATINALGADGVNYAMIGAEDFWQEVSTVPGQPYRLRLVIGNGLNPDAEMSIKIDGVQIGTVMASSGSWQTAEFAFVANHSTTSLGFQGDGNLVNLDQVSLVWLNEPPQLCTPPLAYTAFVGAPAYFRTGISGAEPLTCQWFHDGQPIPGATGRALQLTAVTSTDAGLYWIEAVNPYGSVTSAPVPLVVEIPDSPQFVLHPQSGEIVADQYVVLQSAATGSPPLRYQWYRDGMPLPGAESPTLTLASFMAADAGTYHVVVANGAETATSLPARLTLNTMPQEGGGTILFGNVIVENGTSSIALVYDVDEITRLAGPGFVAQLYVGRSNEQLRPVGLPRPFRTGFAHGQWEPATIALSAVPPETPVFAQVRVWDQTFGNSYEIVRALGGKFGRSEVLSLITGHQSQPPIPYEGAQLTGLTSFSVNAGLTHFTTGKLELAEKLDDGTLTWRLSGARDFRYLIERQGDGKNWLPFTVLTNATGVVTFRDRTDADLELQLYRARIID